MKRRRAALVGGVWVRPAIEQDFHDREIPRAHRLMKRTDPIPVAGIDERAALDEQHRDTRGLGTVRAPQVGDAMKRRFAESIGRRGVRPTIEQVSNDLSTVSGFTPNGSRRTGVASLSQVLS